MNAPIPFAECEHLSASGGGTPEGVWTCHGCGRRFRQVPDSEGDGWASDLGRFRTEWLPEGGAR